MKVNKEPKSITCYDYIKDLTNLYVEYPFLKEIDSMSFRCALFDLDNAIKNLFQEALVILNTKISIERILIEQII